MITLVKINCSYFEQACVQTIIGILGTLDKFYNKKTIIVDLSPEGLTTLAFGISSLSRKNNIIDVVSGKVHYEDAIFCQNNSNFCILPYGYYVEDWYPDEDNFLLLDEVLQKLNSTFDFVFVYDSSLNCFFYPHILEMVDNALFPTNATYSQAIVSVLQGMREFKEHNAKIREKKHILGVVGHYEKMDQIVKEVFRYWEEKRVKLFKPIIEVTREFTESIGLGEFIWDYAPDCKSIKDYRELSQDFLNTCSRKIVRSKVLEDVDDGTNYYGCTFFLPETKFYQVLCSRFEHCSFRSKIQFHSLRGCEFVNCGFSDEFLLDLSDLNLTRLPWYIYTIRDLKTLDISGNSLGDQSMRLLLEHLPDCRIIR
ncbi:ParA family protein [Candidatus Uabimicrobium amorphum]|uniref:Chromosome partitioning protein ParA n=1 Tax=Uabimicrobium amorphum TaxID=2596890 RepID=A0A5S9ITA9_UABAM|nr:ParA family protein [Candidatus Uabimicrobium amorphum]BBM87357.1 chromosome partitioning protein ParA [Candidatus Uabimicrobium amorphum]